MLSKSNFGIATVLLLSQGKVSAKKSRFRPTFEQAPWHKAGQDQLDSHPFKIGHPVDYVVPNFGVDHDILASHASVKSEEKRQDHVWTPKQDPETGSFQTPEPHDNRSYKYK